MFIDDSGLPSTKINATLTTDGKQYVFSKTCSVTNAIYTVKVDAEAYDRWINEDTYIQETLSTLSADEREFLISGLTPAEFNNLFGADE